MPNNVMNVLTFKDSDAAEGLFMLEVGMTEDDLEARDPAIQKVESWLREDYEGEWKA